MFEWCCGIVGICCILVALWILILCCGIVRMWCALEDFLFYFFLVFFLFGLGCECDHGFEGFTHPCGKGRKVQGEGHKLGLHDWGPWSMGSIVCHFHSYSTLGVIREKWWRKEVNEVWVWRKLKLLVVCGGGCLWSPERAWYFFDLWSPERAWYFELWSPERAWNFVYGRYDMIWKKSLNAHLHPMFKVPMVNLCEIPWDGIVKCCNVMIMHCKIGMIPGLVLVSRARLVAS